jgi:hypothetical protein
VSLRRRPRIEWPPTRLAEIPERHRHHRDRDRPVHGCDTSSICELREHVAVEITKAEPGVPPSMPIGGRAPLETPGLSSLSSLFFPVCARSAGPLASVRLSASAVPAGSVRGRPPLPGLAPSWCARASWAARDSNREPTSRRCSISLAVCPRRGSSGKSEVGWDRRSGGPRCRPTPAVRCQKVRLERMRRGRLVMHVVAVRECRVRLRELRRRCVQLHRVRRDPQRRRRRVPCRLPERAHDWLTHRRMRACAAGPRLAKS